MSDAWQSRPAYLRTEASLFADEPCDDIPCKHLLGEVAGALRCACTLLAAEAMRCHERQVDGGSRRLEGGVVLLQYLTKGIEMIARGQEPSAWPTRPLGGRG